MKKISLIFLIVIVSILSYNGCKEDPLQVVKPQNVIMPLAVGNMWVVSYKEIGYSGSVNSTIIDTLKILSDTTINGSKWYKPSFIPFYFSNNDWGLNIFETEEFGEYPYFKYPGEVNYSWITDTVTLASNDYPFTLDTLIYGFLIDKTDTMITVPAGTYSCYHYRNFSRTFAGVETDSWKQIGGDFWLSPGYGMIKSISYEKDHYLSGELIHLELK